MQRLYGRYVEDDCTESVGLCNPNQPSEDLIESKDRRMVGWWVKGRGSGGLCCLHGFFGGSVDEDFIW